MLLVPYIRLLNARGAESWRQPRGQERPRQPGRPDDASDMIMRHVFMGVPAHRHAAEEEVAALRLERATVKAEADNAKADAAKKSGEVREWF